VETGVHKLFKLGVDPLCIESAWGCAPIAPVHPKSVEAMGRTNDVILYGGVVYCVLRYKDDDKLRELLQRAPSSASRQYGKPFGEIFRDASYNFYQIDPNLFAPAVFVVNNVISGGLFRVGELNVEVLGRALGPAVL
jgi:methenyltetrahydromethanopterin cyclohydrolase